ncbi:MAG TPA: homoserine dehydrogenase [Armatimonadetes bacterium]|nr:homoserine dehydrogenase [Armatimonadota bacterium]
MAGSVSTLKVGLLGCGTVGGGVALILNERGEQLLPGARLMLHKVAERDPTKARSVGLDPSIVTPNPWEVVNDPEVDVVVEALGGLHPAKELIETALEKGKHVVTPNKAVIAEFGRELFRKAKEKGVGLGIRATVTGSHPIFEDLVAAATVKSIRGILNGTCNYILTRMEKEELEFEDALKEAQREGYAEADPSLDVDGVDTAQKLVILTRLAFGFWADPDSFHVEGIRRISALDIRISRRMGYRIKLLGVAERVNGEGIRLRVHPALVSHESRLASVEGVDNAVEVRDDVRGEWGVVGPGAGRFPAAGAILSDILQIARGQPLSIGPETSAFMIEGLSTLKSRYYLRFSAKNRPGVLAKLAGILGENGINIAEVLQTAREGEEEVPVVVITYPCPEEALMRAIDEIDRLPIVGERTVVLRVEGDAK